MFTVWALYCCYHCLNWPKSNARKVVLSVIVMFLYHLFYAVHYLRDTCLHETCLRETCLRETLRRCR